MFKRLDVMKHVLKSLNNQGSLGIPRCLVYTSCRPCLYVETEKYMEVNLGGWICSVVVKPCRNTRRQLPPCLSSFLLDTPSCIDLSLSSFSLLNQNRTSQRRFQNSRRIIVVSIFYRDP